MTEELAPSDGCAPDEHEWVESVEPIDEDHPGVESCSACGVTRQTIPAPVEEVEA